MRSVLEKRLERPEKPRATAAPLRPLCCLAAAAICAASAGCHQDMWNQPKYRGLRHSEFFADGAAARPAIPGTIPYEKTRREWASRVFAEITGTEQAPPVTDDFFHTGKVNGALSSSNYFPVSRALLERGQERFEANCMPCHGLLGNGDGIVVRRGFPAPPSYHIPRLLEVEDGHIFDVATRGFGRMYSQVSRVAPEDRWAIAAYIRALQLSQNVNLETLPPAERQRVEEALRAAQASKETKETGHVD